MPCISQNLAEKVNVGFCGVFPSENSQQIKKTFVPDSMRVKNVFRVYLVFQVSDKLSKDFAELRWLESDDV